jgi:glycosyltransferase involved in cell wall biosynthesis
MLDVSVIICAYTEERWASLQAAVDSVRRQTIPPREVIVIIDHNPKLLAQARLALSGVVVAENYAARGLAGARNSSLSLASGSILAFLDDDAIAAPDWLACVLAGYANSNVIGVGGKIDALWANGRPAWFPPEFDWVVGCSYIGLPEEATGVRNLIGCNMSYRKNVFATIGNFHLGYGCDETELCIRLRRHWPEKVLLYQPQAIVFHNVSASRASWRHFCSRCFFEGGSKAVVAWLQGPRDGLASERAYMMKTLPKGILRGVADTLLGRHRAGIARAGAIVVGLAMTTAGYLLGTLRVREVARQRGWSGRLDGEAI